MRTPERAFRLVFASMRSAAKRILRHAVAGRMTAGDARPYMQSCSSDLREQVRTVAATIHFLARSRLIVLEAVSCYSNQW